ncbi:MAG: phosphotransferase [Candidatus Promineifilaceae bacterium]
MARHAIRVSGSIEQPHIQPWSTVLRVPTDAGDKYFKASAKALAFEPAVTQALYQWRSDCIPQLLAIDVERGWMLMADGGQRVREAFGEGLDIHHWSEILAKYADLQITLAGHIDELLSFGVRDRRLEVLPELYMEILADEDWFLIDQPNGITASEYKRLINGASEFAEMCQELATYEVPDSLHHNDLHDGNIFIENGRDLFFDWGDSSISHPFFSMRTVSVSIENTFELEKDHPLIEEFGRGYLEHWTKFETHENLHTAYNIAKRIWSISTAVKYRTFLSQIEWARDDYSDALPSLMKEFLEANPSF